MSNSTDRIPVPTNGHRPPPPAEAPAAPAADDPRVAFTPGQVAAGFGIIAALILLVAGRRRGKRG